MSPTDDLYKKQLNPIPPFQFDQATAAAFDDMAERSIPFYHALQTFTAAVAKQYYRPGSLIYDLGCSTGNTVQALGRALSDPHQVIAVDQSADMVAQARKKAAAHQQVTWLVENIESVAIQNASVINAGYVLQFIAPAKRQDMLRRIYQGLNPGGVLLLSEKTCSDQPDLNRMMLDHYYRFKLEQGYSSLEIQQKEAALKSVLISFTTGQYEELFEQTGFAYWHSVYKFMNFITWMVMK